MVLARMLPQVCQSDEPRQCIQAVPDCIDVSQHCQRASAYECPILEDYGSNAGSLYKCVVCEERRIPPGESTAITMWHDLPNHIDFWKLCKDLEPNYATSPPRSFTAVAPLSCHPPHCMYRSFSQADFFPHTHCGDRLVLGAPRILAHPYDLSARRSSLPTNQLSSSGYMAWHAYHRRQVHAESSASKTVTRLYESYHLPHICMFETWWK